MPAVLLGVVPSGCSSWCIAITRKGLQRKIVPGAWHHPLSGCRVYARDSPNHGMEGHFKPQHGHGHVVQLEGRRGLERIQADCGKFLFLLLSRPTDLPDPLAYAARTTLAGAPVCIARRDRGRLS